MSTSDNSLRLLRVFVVAKTIVHYYYMHTDGDDEDGRVSIENIERVIELWKKIKINKYDVEWDGDTFRGVTERYADGSANIYIRQPVPIEWDKYATVKEYSHLAYDGEEDFEPNPIKTMKDLIRFDGLGISDDMTPAMVSERFAEVLALELIYPHEYRSIDAERLKSGTPLKEIVQERHVPGVYIERATKDTYIEVCQEMWKNLPSFQLPPLEE